jgi:RHS repeat-associated protein
VIEERDGEDNVLASYVYGSGLDEVVSMRRDVLDGSGDFDPDGTPEDYFYLGDMQNNTLVLVDAEGQMVEAYAYGTELRPYVHFEGGSTAQQYPNDFGMPVILDETGAVLHADFTKTGLPTHYQSTDGAAAGTPYASRYGNPWLFNGRAWDAELGLYHYRNRYLDPVQGRFTTRDPIGLWGDSMNLGNGYSYVVRSGPRWSDTGSSFFIARNADAPKCAIL